MQVFQIDEPFLLAACDRIVDKIPEAFVLGRILAEQGQFDVAINETDSGIALAPNDPASNYFYSASGDKDCAAETLNRSGKPAEALEIAENAMRNTESGKETLDAWLAYIDQAVDGSPDLRQLGTD